VCIPVTTSRLGVLILVDRVIAVSRILVQHVHDMHKVQNTSENRVELFLTQGIKIDAVTLRCT
jgi:hypothetical protein